MMTTMKTSQAVWAVYAADCKALFALMIYSVIFQTMPSVVPQIRLVFVANVLRPAPLSLLQFADAMALHTVIFAARMVQE